MLLFSTYCLLLWWFQKLNHHSPFLFDAVVQYFQILWDFWFCPVAWLLNICKSALAGALLRLPFCCHRIKADFLLNHTWIFTAGLLFIIRSMTIQPFEFGHVLVRSSLSFLYYMLAYNISWKFCRNAAYSIFARIYIAGKISPNCPCGVQIRSNFPIRCSLVRIAKYYFLRSILCKSISEDANRQRGTIL